MIASFFSSRLQTKAILGVLALAVVVFSWLLVNKIQGYLFLKDLETMKPSQIVEIKVLKYQNYVSGEKNSFDEVVLHDEKDKQDFIDSIKQYSTTRSFPLSKISTEVYDLYLELSDNRQYRVACLVYKDERMVLVRIIKSSNSSYRELAEVESRKLFEWLRKI